MADDVGINMNLFDENVADVGSSFILKVLGVSETSIRKISDRMGLQCQSADGGLIWILSSSQREFGSVKKQCVQLFAAAAAISFHFPNVRMALGNITSLEAKAPLHLSAATQLYLSHAGLNLAVENQDRVLSPVELQQLREQLQDRAQKPQKKGA